MKDREQTMRLIILTISFTVQSLSAAFIPWDGEVDTTYAVGSNLTSDAVPFTVAGTRFQPDAATNHSVLGVNFTETGWTYKGTVAPTVIQDRHHAEGRAREPFTKGLTNWNGLTVNVGTVKPAGGQKLTGSELIARDLTGGILNLNGNLPLDIVSAAIYGKTGLGGATGNLTLDNEVTRP